MSQIRKDPLVTDNYYHVVSRSIAQYKIFVTPEDYSRFIEIIDLYRFSDFIYKYSIFRKLTDESRKIISEKLRNSGTKIVNIIAYCIMPTHIHLILKQNNEGGISDFMSIVLNSYSRYFNIKYHRKGPLWEGRFKSILVENDDQLLHLSRYIHLNPVSAKLAEKPGKWVFSSYSEYIKLNDNNLSNFKEIIDITPEKYERFVKNQISYQKELAKIKRLLIDNYTG